MSRLLDGCNTYHSCALTMLYPVTLGPLSIDEILELLAGSCRESEKVCRGRGGGMIKDFSVRIRNETRD